MKRARPWVSRFSFASSPSGAVAGSAGGVILSGSSPRGTLGQTEARADESSTTTRRTRLATAANYIRRVLCRPITLPSDRGVWQFLECSSYTPPVIHGFHPCFEHLFSFLSFFLFLFFFSCFSFISSDFYPRTTRTIRTTVPNWTTFFFSFAPRYIVHRRYFLDLACAYVARHLLERSREAKWEDCSISGGLFLISVERGLQDSRGAGGETDWFEREFHESIVLSVS